jgi:hypothetical protein
MSKVTKAKALDKEELSIAEKEEVVQTNAGFDKDSGMYKVDLTKPPVNQEENKEEVVTEDVVTEEPKTEENAIQEQKQLQSEKETEEEEEGKELAVLEEITDEEDTTDDSGVEGSVEATDPTPEQEEVLQEAETQEQVEYPENIQELVKFMNETGGSLEDYVSLNKDYNSYEDLTLLREYYQQAKPHLSTDEVNFLLDDKYSWDDETDDPTDIKRKKLAFKEEVASAKNHLEKQKNNYYKEIKAGSKLTTEQQKAVDFFNRYNEESNEAQKIAQSQRSVFNKKTDTVFNDKFKGFEYNVGDKKYRFNVKNVNEVKKTQSDINNFAKKFLNKNNEMEDAKGYHKSLFTAMNADAIANHFYEQGKSDAIKESVRTSKNINMDPRAGHQEVEVSGMKAKVISGENLSGLKLKLKNY